MLGPSRLVRWVKRAAPPGPGTAPIRRPASTGSAGRHSATDNRRSQEDDCEEALDMDAVEAKLEALVKEEKKSRKATKFHIIRRQLSDRGAPERRLTWDAIEQIRYLKQESPQEWTVQRLAASFSVHPDTISRVLRSKFAPTPERKLEQDSKVLAAVRQLSLGDGQTGRSGKNLPRLPVPDGSAPAMLSEGNARALTAISPKALAPTEFETRLVPSSAAAAAPRSRGTSLISTVAQGTSQEQPEEKGGVEEAEGSEREDDGQWDGAFLTEEELEELVQTLHQKPSAVEQRGREFFDREGNFLYRI